jgi:hypothetical protein
MKVYKTKGGYYYKEYKSGKKKRISKEKFSQLKITTINHSKKPVSKKQVGKKQVGKKPVGKKSGGKKPVGKKPVSKKQVSKKQVGGIILTTLDGIDLISEGQYCKYCSKLLDPLRQPLDSTGNLSDTCCKPCGHKGLQAFKAIKEDLYPGITKLSQEQYSRILSEIRDAIQDSNHPECEQCKTTDTKINNGRVLSRKKKDVDLRDFFSHRFDEGMYKKVSKVYRDSVENDMVCKVCTKDIKSTYIGTNAFTCLYCGYNVHKETCLSTSQIMLYGSNNDERNDERNVYVCAICHDFLDQCTSLDIKANSSVPHNIDIVLRFGSVTENVTDFNDIVLVDAAGSFLKDKEPSGAGLSAQQLYQTLNITTVKAKANSDVFRKLTMGNIVSTKYGNKEVIHAYSYDFNTDPKYSDKNQEQCISLLAKIYSKIFKEFVKSERNTLHLLPLSGGVFAGTHKSAIVSITYNAIQKAFQTIKIHQTRNVLSGRTIKLCLYTVNELTDYYKSGKYILKDSPTFTLLEKENEQIQPNGMSQIELGKKNLQYLRILSTVQYQILSKQTEINQKSQNPQIVLTLYPDIDSRNVRMKCIINYTAIMNALSKFKQLNPTMEISDIVSKLVFKVKEEEYPTYKALFISEFYLMLPFHMRFQNYESLQEEDYSELNRTRYQIPNNILQSKTVNIIDKLDFTFKIDHEGSIGVVKSLYETSPGVKIGLLIAGNSGSPGGMGGKLFGSDYTARYPILNLHRPGDLQEESTIYNWLKQETQILGKRFSPEILLNHSIRGQWGLTDLDQDAKVDDYNTLQGINYTRANPSKYRTAWVYQDCCLDIINPLIKANFVFVAGPNINAEGNPNGSMKRTKNTVLKLSEHTNKLNAIDPINEDELTCTFVQGIKEALRAGLFASHKSGCEIVIVPYVSGGIYLSSNSRVLERFKRLIYPVILNEVLNEMNPTLNICYKDVFTKVILCDIGDAAKMMQKRANQNAIKTYGNYGNYYSNNAKRMINGSRTTEPEPEPQPEPQPEQDNHIWWECPNQ